MRTTWDAAASSERRDEYVGDPATARAELEGLFGRLGHDPHGGVCVEVKFEPGAIFVRDSKDRRVAQPIIGLSSTGWCSFLNTIS